MLAHELLKDGLESEGYRHGKERNGFFCKGRMDGAWHVTLAKVPIPLHTVIIPTHRPIHSRGPYNSPSAPTDATSS